MKRNADIQIGKQCRAYREAMGKTQKQVADELHISRECVNSFENGRFHSTRLLDYYLEKGLEIVLCNYVDTDSIYMED